MLYGWSDVVMARNRSVRYPSSAVPTGLFDPIPANRSVRSKSPEGTTEDDGEHQSSRQGQRPCKQLTTIK